MYVRDKKKKKIFLRWDNTLVNSREGERATISPHLSNGDDDGDMEEHIINVPIMGATGDDMCLNSRIATRTINLTVDFIIITSRVRSHNLCVVLLNDANLKQKRSRIW